MSEESQVYAGARMLVVAASLVVVIAGLRAASSLLIPVLIALFISILSFPLLFWLRSKRCPTGIAVAATILTDLAILAVVIGLVSGSINELVRERAKYEKRFQDFSESVDGWTSDVRSWLVDRGIDAEDWFGFPDTLDGTSSESSGVVPGSADGSTTGADGEPSSPGVAVARPLQADEGIGRWLLTWFDLEAILDAANTTLRGLANILSSTFIVLLITTFILLEATYFRRKLRRAFADPVVEQRVATIMAELRRYLGVKTGISAVTGLLVGIWVAILGVDFAPLWGLVAFALNYIPNLGSIIAAGPPVLLALIQEGVGLAVLVAIGYLVVNIVIGNFVEPALMGRRLGLSVLVVFLSLIFWGWVWGPVGMLLSVPLTMILKIMLENTDDLRWAATLLEGKREPPGRREREAPRRQRKSAA